MKYRALWKSTIYTCEDYGALCRCLAWVGAESFTLASPEEYTSLWDDLLSPNSVVVERIDYEE